MLRLTPSRTKRQIHEEATQAHQAAGEDSSLSPLGLQPSPLRTILSKHVRITVVLVVVILVLGFGPAVEGCYSITLLPFTLTQNAVERDRGCDLHDDGPSVLVT